LTSLPRNYTQFEFPRELLFFKRLSILRVAGGVCDHSRDLLWMGFVHGVARALDFGRMALGPRVVPALKVRIDDLIVPGDDSPARLRLPGGRGQRCRKNLGRGQYLRPRRKFRPLARQIGCEQLGKIRRIEIGEFIRGFLDRAVRLGQDAWRFLAKLTLVFSDEVRRSPGRPSRQGRDQLRWPSTL
jgi:hypothetical protein